MGIEYFLVKPEKEEVFYLGKHFNYLHGINSSTYKSIAEASYPDYEDWDDFFWDMLRENWEYFLGCDLTLEQVSDVVYQIYEWCISDKVILDNDCTESANIWKDWKETGDITKILEKIHNESPSKDFNNYLEEQQSIIFTDPSYNASIIGVTTDGRAVYDYNLMVKELSQEDDITEEEAVEFIEYNTLGSLPQADKYPIVMYKKEDII